MAAKKTYQEVKEYFESQGYELLSKGYVNSQAKLEYRCPEGHSGRITWSGFNSGCRCIFCGGKAKLTIDFIRERFEEVGYTLLSKHYKNCSSKLLCACSAGHKTTISWDNFKQGHRCLVCSGYSKKLLKDIKDFCKSRGLIVLSDSYTNSKSRLICKCVNGHIVKRKWNDIQQGCTSCSVCSRNAFIKRAKLAFLNEGYHLLGPDVFGNKTPLSCVCPEGHQIRLKWRDFNNGCRCSVCFREKYKYSIKEVIEIFVNRGCELLSSEYICTSSLLEYKCSSGHINTIRLNDFIRGHGCPICSRGPISKISQEWLDRLGILQENREILIGGFRVDGFDPTTNTVYEFLGDYWHGNPKIFSPGEINASNKKSFGQLFQETKDRILRLEQLGYKVVVMWESDFNLERQVNG